MEDLIQLVFKTYGLVGILLFAPLIGVVYLWRDNKALNRMLLNNSKSQASELAAMSKNHYADITMAHDKTSAAQLLRVQDAQNIMTKLMELVSEQSSLNKETNIALDNIGDVLSKLG